MKKLSSAIFGRVMLVSALISMAVLVLVFALFYHVYNIDYIASMRSEASVIAGMIESGDKSEAVRSEHRVTLISNDGTVLFDTGADAAAMDDHSDRDEVEKALKNGEGVSKRFSETLKKKTVYYALKLDDGSVLRLSDEQPGVLTLLKGVWWVIPIIFATEVVLSLLLSMHVSKTVTAPINAINLEDPQSGGVYAELKPLINRIETQNVQIAKQLSDQRAEHDQQDAMRRDFTANVSHELKTPLTSISGYAEIIKNGIAKKEDVERFAGKIYDESQRLITLVGDIIKLSQLDGNDVPVKFEQVDLYEVCEAVMSQLEMAAAEKNVTFELHGDHIKINAVEQIVEEIVFNLCDNAVKYNRDGGKVSISITQFVDGVELCVSDTGIGIPKEDIDRIFERFFRVDKSHSKEIGGTGLGLSIVKHGAKFLGATLSVESELGKGTSIRICF